MTILLFVEELDSIEHTKLMIVKNIKYMFYFSKNKVEVKVK